MAIDFDDALAFQQRRERLPKATRQLMREVTQGGNFVDDIAAQIAAGRSDRAMQRQVNRAIGVGPWQGRTPFSTRFDPSLVNPTGATPTRIMGELPPAGQTGRMVGGSSVANSNPIPMGPNASPGRVPVPTGNLPVPTGNLPATLDARPMGQSATTFAGELPAAGQTGRVAGMADDALALGRGAAASPVDDILASAAGAGSTGAAAAGEAAGGAAAAGATTAAGRSSMLANVTRASLMRGAGVAGAGYLASGIIDSMNVGGENSDFDRILSGGALGAGLGAGGALALGLASGPVGWAALGGAALFAGGKYLFGDKETSLEKMQQSVDETRTNIMEVAGMYGLDNSAMEDILMQYDMSAQLYLQNEDKEGLKAYMTGLTQTLPAMMLQQRQTYDQQQQMIAMQAKFAPIFQSQMDRAAQASERAMTTANDVAGYFAEDHPNLAALVRQSAAQSNESSQRLMAAYAQQVAMAPAATYQNFQQQQMMNQMAASPLG